MRVAIYGAGQLGTSVAGILAERGGYEVVGPCGRDRRAEALGSGAEVVLIATTSFLADVADDVRAAVESGSNVLVSAEECAYPWAVDAPLADELDALARAKGVTVLGTGLNPGYAFDALVVTAAGAAREVVRIRVERVVNLGRFSATILRRLGIGFPAEEFARGVEAETIHGHIGFPQSIHVVARKLGVAIERIERAIEPILAERPATGASVPVAPGESVGFVQRYTGVAGGEPWFECLFTGHVDLESSGLEPRDEILIDGPTPVRFAIEPGLRSQEGSSAVVANSVRRVAAAPPGWVTAADLPPAYPG